MPSELKYSKVNIFSFKQSFLEHFGAESIEEVKDPLKPKFLKEFIARGKRNTEIYREIFHAEPDNNQTTAKALKLDRKEFEWISKFNRYLQL